MNSDEDVRQRLVADNFRKGARIRALQGELQELQRSTQSLEDTVTSQRRTEQRLKHSLEEHEERLKHWDSQNADLQSELVRLKTTLSEIDFTASDRMSLVANQGCMIDAVEHAMDVCESQNETGEGADDIHQLREQVEDIKQNSQREVQLREELYRRNQQLEQASKDTVKLIFHQNGAPQAQDILGFGTDMKLEGADSVINSVLDGEHIWIFTSSNDTMSGGTFRDSISFDVMHNLFYLADDPSSGYDIEFTMSVIELHDEYSIDLLAESVQSQVNFVEFIAVLNKTEVYNVKDVHSTIRAARKVQSQMSSECFQHLLILSTRTTNTTANHTTSGKLCMVVSDPCTNIMDYLPPASMDDLMSRTKLLARLNNTLQSLRETPLVEVSDDTLHEFTRRFLGFYCPEESQRTYLDVSIMLDSVTWLAASMAHAPLALLPRKCGRMRSVSQADSEASVEEPATCQVSMKSL